MDYREKSFQQVADTAKLLLALSTGVVAFCASLVAVESTKVTLLTPTQPWTKWIFLVALGLVATSSAVGVWTQLAISHVLSMGTTEEPADVWNDKITVPFGVQILAFAGGMILLTVYVCVRVGA